MQNKINRIYIIGAGASCSYGLPTLKPLTWDLCEFLGEEDRKVLLDAVFEAFGIELERPEDSPDFEELLNRLDARALLYLQEDDYDVTSSLRPRAAAIALNGLRAFIHDKCTSAANRHGPYDTLVQSLTEGQAIISFNWDVMLELAFLRSGIEFTYLPTEHSKDAAILLKPHGSINWFALLDRELLAVDLNTNWDVFGHSLSYYMLYLKDPLGPRDLGKSSPFVDHALSSVPAIVPPTASKMLSVGGVPRNGWVEGGHEMAMRATWSTFRESVVSAQEIVVIGYSLPGTDAASAAILKQFALSAIELESKRVMIVDKNPEVVKRYRRLVHSDAQLICEDFVDFKPMAIY